MGIKFGYYTKDQLDSYDNVVFNDLLRNLLTDGFFNKFGTQFNVSVPHDATEGTEENTFQAFIGSGKLWAEGIWNVIDAGTTSFVDIELGAVDNDRYDEIVLQINTESGSSSLRVLQGIPGQGGLDKSNPAIPYSPDTSIYRQEYQVGTLDVPTNVPPEGVFWYPLAYICVPNGTKLSDIGSKVTIHQMTEYRHYVTSKVQLHPVDVLYRHWVDAFDQWLVKEKEKYNSFRQNAENIFNAFLGNAKNDWSIWFNQAKIDANNALASYWTDFEKSQDDRQTEYTASENSRNNTTTNHITEWGDDFDRILNDVIGEEKPYDPNIVKQMEDARQELQELINKYI